MKSKKFNKSNQGELSQEQGNNTMTVSLRNLKSFSVSDLRRDDLVSGKAAVGGIYKKANTKENTRSGVNLRPNSLLKIKVYSNIITQALNLNDQFLSSRGGNGQSNTSHQPKQSQPVNHIVINQNSQADPSNVNEAAVTNPIAIVEQENHFKKRRTSL